MYNFLYTSHESGVGRAVWMGCRSEIYSGTTKRIASVIQRGLSASARLLFPMPDRSLAPTRSRKKSKKIFLPFSGASDRLAANLGSEYAPWDKIVRPWDRRIAAALGDRTGRKTAERKGRRCGLECKKVNRWWDCILMPAARISETDFRFYPSLCLS